MPFTSSFFFFHSISKDLFRKGLQHTGLSGKYWIYLIVKCLPIVIAYLLILIWIPWGRMKFTLQNYAPPLDKGKGAVMVIPVPPVPSFSYICKIIIALPHKGTIIFRKSLVFLHRQIQKNCSDQFHPKLNLILLSHDLCSFTNSMPKIGNYFVLRSLV